MQERFFSPGMDPGVGVNVLTGDVLVTSVTGATVPPAASGQRVESRLIRIDDISSLQKSIGVDVSASGSYMGFSASAKVDYADSCNFNQHSIYLLISIKVTNALTRIDSPVLTDEAAELLRNHKPDRFRERFGDVFVAGVHTGGEYFAIFQITGTDESEKESLAVQVNASYTTIGAGASLGVAVNTAKQSSHNHLDMKVFTFQNGGSDTTQDQNVDQIMTKAHNFAPSVRGEFAVAYSILPESYRTLKLPDDAANPIDIENQRQALADAWNIRNELLVLKNDIDYILLSDARQHDEFEAFDVPALTTARNTLAAEIDSITQGASACMRDALQCKFVKFDTSAIKLPKRKASAGPAPVMVTIPNWGDAETVERGGFDPASKITYPSADELGLLAKFVVVPNPFPSGHGSDIISILPPVGASVTRGSTVTITIYDRGHGPDD